MTPSAEIEPGPHWWKASALTTIGELDKRGNVGNRLGCSDFSKGWALHEPKGGGSRYSDNDREYLTAKYDLEETTGNKCDLQQVADDMRNSKLAHGEQYFSREEWLSKAQSRSAFSSIRQARRNQTVLQSERQIDVDPDDDFGTWLEEIELPDQAIEENEFRDQVMNKINVGHPLVFDIYILCELCDKKRLAKFNVKLLKEICSYLEIQVNSRDTKMSSWLN